MFLKSNVSESTQNGWFYGHFMSEGLQKDNRLEIKVINLDNAFSSEPHYSKVSTKIDIVWEGEAIWEIDGEEVMMSKGDYIIIPPLVKVGIKKIISEQLTVQTIKIPSTPDDKFF